MDGFNYAGIPRHCEEAVLLFQQLNGGAVDLRGRQIRPETRQRFELFSEAVKRQETPEGRQRLVRDFGNTYWCYYFLPPAASKPTAAHSAESQ